MEKGSKSISQVMPPYYKYMEDTNSGHFSRRDSLLNLVPSEKSSNNSPTNMISKERKISNFEMLNNNSVLKRDKIPKAWEGLFSNKETNASHCSAKTRKISTVNTPSLEIPVNQELKGCIINNNKEGGKKLEGREIDIEMHMSKTRINVRSSLSSGGHDNERSKAATNVTFSQNLTTSYNYPVIHSTGTSKCCTIL